MRIDQPAVALRARNAWESFDLGFALARHTGANLFLAFALPYLACALLINLLLWGSPTAAMLIVWWLKPAFDRIALHVVSQTVFGDTPSWRATLANWRQIPRSGLLYALTFGRFDFARSFHLAVLQLEGQKGRARGERISLLDRGARGPAVWLTIVILHFVYVLLLGMDGFLKMISPEGMQFSLRLGDFFSFGVSEPSLISQYLFNAAFALIECVLEPIYVAAGFSLYLSRRTVLEGWDLEVAFKRMSARIAAVTASMKKTAVLAFAAMLLQGIGADSALAQTAPPATSTTSATLAAEKRLIDEILAGPEFKQTEARMVWRQKKTPEEQKKPPQVSESWLTFARYVAEVMRVLAWVAAILFIGWLLYYLSRRLGWFRDLLGSSTVFKPDVLFGMDLRAESLPDDIPAAARALLAQGDLRAALSLLYRGALRVLIHERELDVREGDTEGDCVRRVSRATPGAPAEYFRRLVDAWGLIAYARRAPEHALAHALVEDWANHFMPCREDAQS